MPDEAMLPTAEDLRKVVRTALKPGGIRIYASPDRDKLIAEWPSIELAIAHGRSVRSLLAALDVDVRAFYDLIEESPAHGQRYARARAARADHWSDKIETVATDLLNENSEVDANRARVAIDALKWTAAKLHPQMFGENKQLSVEVTHKRDPAELDEAQLQLIAKRAAVIDVPSVAVGTSDSASDSTSQSDQ